MTSASYVHEQCGEHHRTNCWWVLVDMVDPSRWWMIGTMPDIGLIIKHGNKHGQYVLTKWQIWRNGGYRKIRLWVCPEVVSSMLKKTCWVCVVLPVQANPACHNPEKKTSHEAMASFPKLLNNGTPWWFYLFPTNLVGGFNPSKKICSSTNYISLNIWEDKTGSKTTK